jgi:hypothetical protein
MPRTLLWCSNPECFSAGAPIRASTDKGFHPRQRCRSACGTPLRGEARSALHTTTRGRTGTVAIAMPAYRRRGSRALVPINTRRDRARPSARRMSRAATSPKAETIDPPRRLPPVRRSCAAGVGGGGVLPALLRSGEHIAARGGPTCRRDQGDSVVQAAELLANRPARP